MSFRESVENDILTMQRSLDVSRFLYSRVWVGMVLVYWANQPGT